MLTSCNYCTVRTKYFITKLLEVFDLFGLRSVPFRPLRISSNRPLVLQGHFFSFPLLWQRKFSFSANLQMKFANERSTENLCAWSHGLKRCSIFIHCCRINMKIQGSSQNVTFLPNRNSKNSLLQVHYLQLVPHQSAMFWSCVYNRIISKERIIFIVTFF